MEVYVVYLLNLVKWNFLIIESKKEKEKEIEKEKGTI